MKSFLKSTTARVAATYLGLIMTLSIGFSYALYNTSSHAIGRQLPPDSLYYNQFGAPPGDFDDFFRSRIAQGRHDIIVHMVVLNILALLIGAGISYYLARRTLQPIENAMEAQARFSADASHELRTPLTAIRTRNEVALRKPSLKLTDAKEVIKSNLDEARKLENLSEGLLLLSHSDGHEIAFGQVSLGEVANEAMNRLIEAAQTKNIQIEDSVPDISVRGDSASLTQAISVLLDNAVKYGHKNDTILLNATHSNGYAYFTVSDSGPGIRASDLPHIFDRFYRADHSRTRQGDNGYGLGLSIAKQIIDQHGGEISVTSKLDEGSVFTIKLHLYEP